MNKDIEDSDWQVPKQAQPKQSDVSFNLNEVLDSVVLIRSEVPEDAMTAQILGSERVGNGILIDHNGLILTVGYLIAEATKVWITLNDGFTVLGDVVCYEHETGFGLVQALGKLNAIPMNIGNSSSVESGDPIIFAAAGGKKHSLFSNLASKRAFVGSWEYALEEALFTVPVHPNWAGAGLIDRNGNLVGIGSLFVQDAGPKEVDGNMSIPINLFKTVMKSMKELGSSGKNPRPWLGLYISDNNNTISIAGMVSRGPAAEAGFKVGDQILSVNNQEVIDLHHFYKSMWALGDAGIEIRIKVLRENKGEIIIGVKSIDRQLLLRKPMLNS